MPACRRCPYRAVFIPAGGGYCDGKITQVYIIYRATDIASNRKEGPFISRLGYAVSWNGLHFKREENALLTNEGPQELRGLEDPRIPICQHTCLKVPSLFSRQNKGAITPAQHPPAGHLRITSATEALKAKVPNNIFGRWT